MEGRSLDLISNLPEEVLLQVSSFLPLKEAVRTSILSNSWKDLWAPHHVNLDNDSDPTEVIGNLLGSFINPEIWELCLSSSSGNCKMVATKGVERELHLDFYEEKKRSDEKTLINLELELPCLNSPKSSTFDSLKILHLRGITRLGEDIIPNLFSNFGFLESLKLEKCVELWCLVVKAGSGLKSLTVEDCPDIVQMTVSAPNLSSFLYQGVLPEIRLEDFCELVDVKLDLSDGLCQNGFDCEEVLALLEALKDVETLTLSGWLLEWLCAAGVIFTQLEFRFNKLRELWWIDSSLDEAKRDSMAYFLDICPSLERLFINARLQNTCGSVDGEIKSTIRPHFHQFWHEPFFGSDYWTLKATSLQLKHLKVVRLWGFETKEEDGDENEDQLLLVDLLLKKALMLKSMVVTSLENSHSWEVVNIPSSQLQLVTKRQLPKQIYAISPTKDCYFGFVEEDDTAGLWPLHGNI